MGKPGLLQPGKDNAMPRKLEGGFDFHGTTAKVQKLKERFSKKFFGSTIAGHLLKREIIRKLGFNEARYDRLLEYVIERPSIFREAEPIEGALEVIEKLEEDAHILKIVTSSGDRAFSCVCDWCTYKNVFHSPTSEVWSVGRDWDKDQFAARFKFDFFLENDVDKIEKLIGIVSRPFLLTDEHNRDKPTRPEIIRVDSWWEFYDHIQLLANLWI